MIEKSLVVGSGNWGTTLAKILGDNDKSVTLWVLEDDVAEDIRTNRLNSRFLPGVNLPDQILVKTDYENFDEFDLIILVIPVNSTRSFLAKVQNLFCRIKESFVYLKELNSTPVKGFHK